MNDRLLEQFLALIYCLFGIVLVMGAWLVSSLTLEGYEDQVRTEIVLFAVFAAISLIGSAGVLAGRRWGKFVLLGESGVLLIIAIVALSVALFSSFRLSAGLISGIIPLSVMSALLWQLKPTRGRPPA